MLTLVPPILAASLLGSAHCAGMCGGFVAFYAGSDASSGAEKSFSHLAYHGGRGLTYALLGALAGGLGHALDLAGDLAGIQRSAAIVAGLSMSVWGAAALARALGARIPPLPLPKAILAVWGRALSALRGRPPVLRAGLLGLASALLPCGWLYAFVVTAAGTGSPLWGAVAMIAFWMGTLPILVGLGVGVQHLTGPLRAHLPKVTALVLVAMGLFAVFHRAGMPQAQPGPPPSITGLQGASQQLEKIEQGEEGKCCHGHPDEP